MNGKVINYEVQIIPILDSLEGEILHQSVYNNDGLQESVPSYLIPL